ncbi:MAG: efflux RND transporter periplasmic adaptor subunit [Opitutaceae bacterium]
MKRTILTSSAVVFIFAASACHRPAHESDALPDLPTIQVNTTTVEIQTVRGREEIPGTIRPVDRAMIAAKVIGTIDSLPVSLGQRVSRGDLLVSILAGEISAKVLQAQAQLDQASRDLARERELLTKGASTSETVSGLENRVRIMQAAVSEAETMLSYTRINAPFDGVITRKLVNEGDLASPGLPLVEIENPDRLQVEIDIPEMLAQTVVVGTEVEVVMPGGEWTGLARIKELAPAADPVSRTFHAKVTVPANTPVRSGQFARVRLPGRQIEAILVPTSAVSYFGQIERVYVVEGNRADLRIVKSGASYGDRVEILSGLGNGDIIVVNPPAGLVDGQPLEIL